MVNPHVMRRLQQVILQPTGRFVEVQAEDIIEVGGLFPDDVDIQAMVSSCSRVLPTRRGPRDVPSKRIWIGTERIVRLINMIGDLKRD